ncbi:hypothetical protein THIOKS12580013 [Thiocapsa sp. KS1]|nr:hypothetical protein THIOKS12580013 [Thiocapsa sp. KS1]
MMGVATTQTRSVDPGGGVPKGWVERGDRSYAVALAPDGGSRPVVCGMRRSSGHPPAPLNVRAAPALRVQAAPGCRLDAPAGSRTGCASADRPVGGSPLQSSFLCSCSVLWLLWGLVDINGELLGGDSRVGSLAAPFAGVLGLLGARGADALQEDGSRLVVRVLGDKLATEGFDEVCLIEMIEKLCSY